MSRPVQNSLPSPPLLPPPISNTHAIWQMNLLAAHTVQYQKWENWYRIQCGARLIQLDPAIITVFVRVKGGHL